MHLKKHLKLAKMIKDLRKKLSNPIQQKKLDSIKSILDDDYHSNIDENQFKKFGHIYYGDNNESKTS